MEEIKQLIREACTKLFDVDIEPELTRTDEQFGDYSTNVALQLGGKLNNPPAGGPREIAEVLANELKNDSITKVEIAGPGFINITLTDTALWKLTESQADKVYQDKVVLVEYSDPNPLKPLHAGHLYTTLVGDIIARLFEYAGAKTIRLNYGGDVGRHIGISMWAIIKELGGENPEKLNDIVVTERPSWLGERYVEGTTAFEGDENSKEEIMEINKRVYQLHASSDHDTTFARIYWTVRQWSYDYFNLLYHQLQVVPFDRFIPESEVTPLGLKTVQEQTDKGVYEKSDGAIIFRGEEYGLHTRVFINSAGLPTYETKDVGLILTKWRDYHFDTSLVITGNEQAQYYQVMLKSVEQFEPEPVKHSRHLTHGLIRLAGGVKMSSRKGNVVTAIEILDAARQAGEKSTLNPNEDTILAAVRYSFAKSRTGGDIIYDPVESVALEGNSGPYLQYAHARACSILSKSENKDVVTSAELEEGERSLVRKIGKYPEVVNLAVNDLMPHHICTYLYELAQEFNRFYEKNKVIGNDRENLRVTLVAKYAQTLKDGLSLLGISAPERM